MQENNCTPSIVYPDDQQLVKNALDFDDDNVLISGIYERIRLLFTRQNASFPTGVSRIIRRSAGLLDDLDTCHNVCDRRDAVSNTTDSLDGCDDIIGMFVLDFNHKLGTVVEWKCPADLFFDVLLEFRALPSGAHLLEKDFVYFKAGRGAFGLACFQKMDTNNANERGMRLKSLGLLSHSFLNLVHYRQFLEQQVERILFQFDYQATLEAFYEDHRRVNLVMGVNSLQTDSVTESVSSSTSYSLSSATTSCNQFLKCLLPLNFDSKGSSVGSTVQQGAFCDMVDYFGPTIYCLWKLILLRKRILMYSPPPIGPCCQRVFALSCLSATTNPNVTVTAVEPLFYVPLNDIDKISKESCYIACCTDFVLRDKREIYDVFVQRKSIDVCVDCDVRELLKPSSLDQQRYRELQTSRAEFRYAASQVDGGDANVAPSSPERRRRGGSLRAPITEEHLVLAHFVELNDRLHSTLQDAAGSCHRNLTEQQLRFIGLHPRQDMGFVQALAELHSLDVMLVVDHTCCN